MERIGRLVGVMALLFAFVQLGAAQDRTEFQKQLNDLAVRVKQTQDPVQKRAMLDDEFRVLTQAVNTAAGTPFATDADRAALKAFGRTISEKRDELNGTHGFARVADRDLNNFADYSVQSLEQADQWVYISTGTILIILLIVLLLR